MGLNINEQHAGPWPARINMLHATEALHAFRVSCNTISSPVPTPDESHPIVTVSRHWQKVKLGTSQSVGHGICLKTLQHSSLFLYPVLHCRPAFEKGQQLRILMVQLTGFRGGMLHE